MKLGYKIDGGRLIIVMEGDFHNYDDAGRKKEIMAHIILGKVSAVVFDGTRLGQWDSTLAVFLFDVLKTLQGQNIVSEQKLLPDNLRRLLDLALTVDRKPERPVEKKFSLLERMGDWAYRLYKSFSKGLDFILQTLAAMGRMFRGKAVYRRVDFEFSVEDSSYKAVAIVSLVSFMVGLILAFVGAIQLKNFGAQIYVASLVAIGMTRIMGAIMVGIIMAGRTGASYAATIGTMQVNEEIDALKTMGIPVTDFLIVPRIGSLILTMPFLVILADFTGILGGAAVGVLMLDIPWAEYWKYSHDALNMTNFLVGIFHGFVYGFVIAWCGCYYGINSGRNADSVGVATTRAVVSAIVWMIVVTGVLTLIFEVMGI